MKPARAVDNYVMKKFSTVIDTLLTAAALFLLCSVIAGYFTRKTSAILLSSLTAAVALTFFTGRLAERRKAPSVKKRKLRELMNKLLFSPPEYAQAFTVRAISNRAIPSEKNGFVLAGKTAFAVRLVPEKIGAATLAERYSAAAKLGARKLVILSAYGAESDAAETARLLAEPTAEIWDFEKVYDFFERLGCAPTETMKLEPQKRKFGALAAGALKKENARKFLFSSIVLLLWARFVPYSALYVIIASISVVVAIFCRFKPNERKRKAKRR